MKEVLEFLKNSKTFYLATCDENGQPRVRPFGAVYDFEDRLYIITSNQKDVFGQIRRNSKIEICSMYEGEWIRIAANVIRDTRREAKVAMLEANPNLTSMYSADDDIMEVWYLENVKATISSFTAAPRTIEF